MKPRAIQPIQADARALSSKKLILECVLFDLDGTLYHSPDYSARVEAEITAIVAQTLNTDVSEAKLRLDEERKKRGTLTGALRVLGVNRSLFFEALAEKIDPLTYLAQDPSVISTVKDLKKRGLKLGLVTNNGRRMVRKILSAIGLDSSLFDVIVTSDESEPKPSSQPFLFALDKLKCTPDETAYIGDRVQAELSPAKELGIKTVLLAREGIAQISQVDIVITRLPEVLNLIEPRQVNRETAASE